MLETAEVTIANLLETAPQNLKRTSPPAILSPEIMEFSGFGMSYMPLLEETKSLVGRLKEAAARSKIKALSIPARKMLSLGLEIPKNVHDKHGGWYLRTIGSLLSLVTEQRFGRRATRDWIPFSSHPASMFHDRARTWREGTYEEAERGDLWEFGIVLESLNGDFNVFSISVPWDGTREPWFKHLTPKEIFIGREAELDAVMQFVAGMSLKEVEVVSAFSADDIKVWWGQVEKANKILKGKPGEIDMKIRPFFFQRIIELLKKQMSAKEFYEMVKSASFISGYYVTAYKSKFPGAIELKMHLDGRNWLEPYPRRSKIEKKKEPARELMWAYGSEDTGGLYNSKLKEGEHGDFDVFIKISPGFSLLGYKDEYGGSVGVEEIQISRVLVLKEHRGTRYYCINSSSYGNATVLAKNIPRPRDFKPMQPKDWRAAAELFKRARQRAVVDSPTFYDQGKKKGLTKRTRAILDNAWALLRREAEKDGVDLEN